MYTIIIAPKARKQIKNLPPVYIRSVKEAILDLKEDPFLGKELRRELKGRYCYGIGVYRIVYKIDEQSKTINILLVMYRSIVYL